MRRDGGPFLDTSGDRPGGAGWERASSPCCEVGYIRRRFATMMIIATPIGHPTLISHVPDSYVKKKVVVVIVVVVVVVACDDAELPETGTTTSTTTSSITTSLTLSLSVDAEGRWWRRRRGGGRLGFSGIPGRTCWLLLAPRALHGANRRTEEPSFRVMAATFLVTQTWGKGRGGPNYRHSARNYVTSPAPLSQTRARAKRSRNRGWWCGWAKQERWLGGHPSIKLESPIITHGLPAGRPASQPGWSRQTC